MDGKAERTEAAHPPCRFLRQGETHALPPGEVHFWTFSLVLPAGAQLGQVESALSADERDRGVRLLLPDARRRFAVAHLAQREVLSAYLGVRAGQVAFSFGKLGKPLMADESKAWLRFNLSHSLETAVIACARDRDVGVDVESLRQDLEHDAMVESHFSAAEKREWATLQPSERALAFLRAWTCKEAYVKALGEGLNHPPGSYTVRLRPTEPAALLDDRLRPGAELAWALHTPPAPPGYIAAIAVAGFDANVISRPRACLQLMDTIRDQSGKETKGPNLPHTATDQ
jgi:4'-phosphopantetheinyl transferase